MLLTKEVEVIPSGKNIKYYKDLGYDSKCHVPLMVKVEDLPKSSNKYVEVLCDYCNKETFSIRYHDYNKEKRHIDKHACKNCWLRKLEDVNLIKYGVKNTFQLKGVQEKCKASIKSRYGVSNPLQSKEIKNKQSQTIFDTYGVYNISQLDEVKKQKVQTMLKHFGVDNAAKSEEIKEKTRNTNLQKYGVPYTQQSPEVRAKVNETLCKNGAQKTSKQQLYLHSLYGGEINYPILYYATDICLPKENLVIEYDGGGHDLRVTLGRLTQEEFNQKEIVRNNIIKREGYKQMRIISSKDKLPSDTILLQMLSEARNYFSTYPNHSWIEFNIDTSTIRNAEYKGGIPYYFGSLRIIKESDLQSQHMDNQLVCDT